MLYHYDYMHLQLLRLLFCTMYLLTFFLSEGCSKKKESTPGLPFPRENPLCQRKTFTEDVTLSGKAVFEYRTPITNPSVDMGCEEQVCTKPNVKHCGLSEVCSPKPIRFADIEVLSGNCITSGQTDKNGEFSLEVPYENQKEYTIKVMPRADNSEVKVSVQDDPHKAQNHFISKKITLENNSPIENIVLTAPADETGGAFNIYDQILEANRFLREQTKDCQDFISTCQSFTEAPKVYAYWKKGFNPVKYLSDSSTSSFSFYLPERKQLFIVGGSNDNIEVANTDHFDNVIILHEYGHFVEEVFSIIDTPGGSHNARHVIDPRLAWSEGFATFFASAVLGKAGYFDSEGIVPKGLLKINEDLEHHPPTRDLSKADGEGNFREFSVVRALWDMIDPYTYNSTTIESQDDKDITDEESNLHVGDKVNEGSFKEFWSIFSGPFKDKKYHFRDYGLFMFLQNELENKTDLSNLFKREKQKPNREDFAAPFPIPENRRSSGCPITIKATDLDERERDVLFSSYPEVSNQHSSNDFYLYEHKGGRLSIELTYNPTNANTLDKNKADLNLYLYNDEYSYQEEDDMIGSSDDTDDEGSENIQVDTPKDVYMVNVMVWTRKEERKAVLGDESTYNLKVNGKSLCP